MMVSLRFLLIILIAFQSLLLYGQKNAIKARAIGMSGNLRVYSLGIGYERLLGESWSLQALYNHQGWNITETDGSGEITDAFLLEGRFYFGEHKRESINRASFIGAFAERGKRDYLLSKDKSYSFSHGLFIGRNTPVGKKWFVEWFVGGKYIVGKTVFENPRFIAGGFTNEQYYHQLGLRLGFNLGFRF